MLAMSSLPPESFLFSFAAGFSTKFQCLLYLLYVFRDWWRYLSRTLTDTAAGHDNPPVSRVRVCIIIWGNRLKVHVAGQLALADCICTFIAHQQLPLKA
jgi:hypothetical protein